MDKTTKILTRRDVNALKKIFELFELQTVRETGVHRISGGYAIASIYDYDNKMIDIELKWGIQSDEQNDTHIENWHLDRRFIHARIPLKEKVSKIDN